MTASLRIRIGLAKLTFAAMASTSLLALALVGAQPAMAQSHRPAALTGTVSSQQEGKMEGVVVSAKRRGSTIMVSVSTNAQGQYAFPQDRLAPGIYDITMRAVGYTLKLTSGSDPIGRARASRPSAREGRAGCSRAATDQQRMDAKRAGHSHGKN